MPYFRICPVRGYGSLLFDDGIPPPVRFLSFVFNLSFVVDMIAIPQKIRPIILLVRLVLILIAIAMQKIMVMISLKVICSEKPMIQYGG